MAGVLLRSASMRAFQGAMGSIVQFLSKCLLVVLVARNLRVLLARFRHELREILLFRLRDGFWLAVDVSTAFPVEFTVDRTFIFTTRDPPWSSIVDWMDSIARSSLSTAAYYTAISVSLRNTPMLGMHTLSVAFVLRTYSGGATSFALIGTASLLCASPARSAFLIASIPAGV